jgi:hypothetical protein
MTMTYFISVCATNWLYWVFNLALLLEGTGGEYIIMYTLCMVGFVIRNKNNV